MDNAYGYCPRCGAPGKTRERRINGNDRCENGHEYPSKSAVHKSITKLAASPQQQGSVVPDAPFDLDVKLCTATYTISSSAVDNDGDILIPEGSLPHLQRYTANPVVLWNHNRDCAPIAQSINPITKQLSWSVESNRVRATAHFHGMTQESAQCWALVENGILRGASVGFDAVEGKTERLPGGGMKFLEWIPIEWSVCPIPNNPETLLEAVNRNWDGKALAPSIIKSLMAYVPKPKRIIVPMIQPRSYVKHDLPWVQSRQKTIKDSAMADEAQTPAEEVKDDGGDVAANPPGAQAIMGFTADIESALANLNTALGSIENPDVLALFEGVGSAIEEQVITLKDGLQSIYPDLNLDDAEPDGDEAKADDEPDGDEKSKAKSLKKSDDEPKGDHLPHVQAIQDAGEVVKEMSESPNVPKSYRMACKGVHGGLMACSDYMSKAFAAKADDEKPVDKPELPEDQSEDKPAPKEEEKADEEVSEDDMKAIKALQAELAGVRKQIKLTTGKVQ